MSAGHDKTHLDKALQAFAKVGKQLGSSKGLRMKALVKSKAEKGIWLEDVPVPCIGENDVLIKIKKTAICGTDVHIYNWDEWAQEHIKVTTRCWA